MPLTPRQERFYTDVIDIYKPEATSTVDRVANDPRYPATPTVSSVPCKLFTSTEYATDQTYLGRTNEDMVLTFDKVHVAADVDIDDTYVFRLRNAGHPDEGGFWVCMGNAKLRPSAGVRRANYRQVLCKRIATSPPGVVI